MPPPRWRVDARTLGGAVCAAGLALLAARPLLSAALGLELVALAFWWWARAAEDAAEQVPRWAWLRRPAQALWLAAAVGVLRGGAPRPGGPGLESLTHMLELAQAAAIAWAGLELMAALPLARPYSDRPGPLLGMSPWLPVLLPAAGFVVLWRHAEVWSGVPEVRAPVAFLLLLTAALAALRAFGRRQWTAGLRWLAVSDCALAGLLIVIRAVRPEVSLLLWLGACGGRASMLAGELHGAAARRGAGLSRLWRTASWVGSAALAWPTLITIGFGRGGGPHGLPLFVAASAPVALTAWINVRRVIEAPERRQVMRPDPGLTLSHLSAVLTLVLGPVALLIAWWSGFEASWPASGLALLPALLGGSAALLSAGPLPQVLARRVDRAGSRSRAAARATFRIVVALERRLVDVLTGLVRGVSVPLRDLHTGDAQEYLLLLVGLSVFALLLPLLR